MGSRLEDTKGFNPYKFGFGAASDSHDTGVPYRQDNFFGAHGIGDGTIETRMSGHLFAGLDVRKKAPPGSPACGRRRTRASRSSTP